MAFRDLFGGREKEIRGLSVTQPWASLIAVDAKTIETRSWSTAYRGLLAIHASKSFPKACRSLCWRDPFRAALLDAGMESSNDETLPLGSVVAVARLHMVMASEDIVHAFTHPAGQATAANASREQAFGDYSPKRYGWFLTDVVRLKKPVPARGALGLWTFDDQPEALAHVRQQLREAA